MMTWFFVWSLIVSPGVPGTAQPVTSHPITFDKFTSQQDCETFRATFNARVQAAPYGWSTTVCQAKP